MISYRYWLTVIQETPMSRHPAYLTSILLSAFCLAGSPSSSAPAQRASLPNFAPHSEIGWYNYGRQFMPPVSGPGPVQQDPERPYVTNDEFRVSGRQPTE